MYLVIVIESDDESDLVWLKDKCYPAVENQIDESNEEGRLDGGRPLSWVEIVERLDNVGRS